jgi:TetR/AcrR family transcriptional repressor of nem operon
MARPREFDVAEALDRAMHVFWAKGYEAASLDDLCAATELSRSSLYAAFGGKRDLLLRSLDSYAEHGTERIAETLTAPPLRAALAVLARRFIYQIVAGPGRTGCFIGNCTAELARRDQAVAASLRRALGRTEATFHRAIAKAKARGELSAEADVRALARFLTSSFQGLRLIGKVNPDRAFLGDIALVMLRCLDE